ncbi:MAG: metal-dependent hydrolase [Pseudonocardiales bacterium]|nr:metal-dependent hydrolase [Jatrophihabitantaceae bacterium]MCW2604867.1 metal-dependent hydrolase [Pseudonocardiales bacterium]
MLSHPGRSTADDAPDIEVRRSDRRRRTVSAYREGDRIIVLLPARFTRAQEREWVPKMVDSVLQREQRAANRGPRRSDDVLMSRAGQLSARHLNGLARPSQVRWVATMRTRWASCTPVDGTIRVSERLRTVPDWVLDYVLVHELAHLLVPGHGPDFWAWVERYPRTERARGYLEGLSAGAGLEIGTDTDTDSDADEPDLS